jgi:hypothetical protein
VIALHCVDPTLHGNIELLQMYHFVIHFFMQIIDALNYGIVKIADLMMKKYSGSNN